MKGLTFTATETGTLVSERCIIYRWRFVEKNTAIVAPRHCRQYLNWTPSAVSNKYLSPKHRSSALKTH